MREVLGDLLRWHRSGERAALATVIATWNSAPRQPGASLCVGPDDSVAGSVSGGCVEADVYALGQQVRDDGRPVLQRYGVSDHDAFAVGLTCGGTLEVFVEPISAATCPELGRLAADLDDHRAVAVATVVSHLDPARVGRRLVLGADGPASGSLGSDRADAAVTDDARGLLAAGTTEVIEYGPEGQRRGEGMRVFVHAFQPRPRLIVMGAIDFAAALARAGAFVGYRVTVCDPRPLFATRARFPDIDEVVVARGDRYLEQERDAGRLDARTAVCVITHQPVFDVPLLSVALTLDLAYVGAMGSRRTHDQRLAALRAAGVSEDALAGLRSPIGLDLGARTPEETAVAIVAEMVADRWGGSGLRLRERSGPIHHPAGERMHNHGASPAPAAADRHATE